MRFKDYFKMISAIIIVTLPLIALIIILAASWIEISNNEEPNGWKHGKTVITCYDAKTNERVKCNVN